MCIYIHINMYVSSPVSFRLLCKDVSLLTNHEHHILEHHILSYHSYVNDSRYIYAGRLDKTSAAWEMIAQFIGALCGGILLKISLPHT